MKHASAVCFSVIAATGGLAAAPLTAQPVLQNPTILALGGAGGDHVESIVPSFAGPDRLVLAIGHTDDLTLSGPGINFFTNPVVGSEWESRAGVKLIDFIVAQWPIGEEFFDWRYRQHGPEHNRPPILDRLPGGEYILASTTEGPGFTMPVLSGPSMFETTITAPGVPNPDAPFQTNDPVFTRLNAQGQQVWLDVPEGGWSNFGKTATAARDGFYVAGTTRNSLAFNPGEASEIELVMPEGLDAFRAYLARYDLTGTVQWATWMGGGSNVETGMDEDVASNGCATLSDGAVATAGYARGEFAFFAGSPFETEAEVSGISDVFIAVVEKNGEPRWARLYGTADSAPDGNFLLGDWGWCVAAMPGGDVLVGGTYSGSLNLPGVGGPIVLPPSLTGASNMFAMRLRASDGLVRWARAFSDPSFLSAPYRLRVRRDGLIAMAGVFLGNLTDDAGNFIGVHGGNGDGFVILLDGDDGETRDWLTVGGPGAEFLPAVNFLPGNRIAVGGAYSSGARVFTSDGGSRTLPEPAGGTDLLLAVYDVLVPLDLHDWVVY